MTLDIRRLTPDLADDYMHYFKHVAFADHADWAGCCCLHFHWNDALEADLKAFLQTCPPDGERDLSFNWAYAERYVRNGTIQGYLAYLDGQVAGWCNANDKQNFAALPKNVPPALWTEEPEQRVKAGCASLSHRICAGKASPRSCWNASAATRMLTAMILSKLTRPWVPAICMLPTTAPWHCTKNSDFSCTRRKAMPA